MMSRTHTRRGRAVTQIKHTSEVTRRQVHAGMWLQRVSYLFASSATEPPAVSSLMWCVFSGTVNRCGGRTSPVDDVTVRSTWDRWVHQHGVFLCFRCLTGLCFIYAPNRPGRTCCGVHAPVVCRFCLSSVLCCGRSIFCVYYFRTCDKKVMYLFFGKGNNHKYVKIYFKSFVWRLFLFCWEHGGRRALQPLVVKISITYTKLFSW